MPYLRTRFRIRVAPGAMRPGVVGRHGEGWKVRVAAPPVDGRANESLRRLLADVLAVPPGDVRVDAGAGARDKLVEVAGLDGDDAHRRLAAAADPDEVMQR